LVLSGNTLYGTTTTGGGFQRSGTVFALNLAIPLNVQISHKSLLLSWTNSTLSYSLQAAPALDGIYTNIPGATSPYTNAMTAPQMFFRLQGD